MNNIRLANYVLERLKINNFDAFYVGGCVRDHLLKMPINDIDITTNATPYEVEKLFKTKPTGIKYGTVTVLDERVDIEVTTFRTEEGYYDHRRPSVVEFTLEVKEDVLRRDFTINALLMDDKLKVIDYVGGLEDLNNKIIRAVGNPLERFTEDSLRMLRACYFESKLGFEIESETFDSIKENASLITHLANERVLAELIKILKGNHQLKALKSLEDTTLHKYLPGLEKGIEYINKNIEERLFTDTFFALAFSLNGSVPREWKLSNLLINKYKKVVDLVLLNEDIDELTLYEYGLEISLLANKIMFMLNKKPFLKRQIEEKFAKLVIKSMTDLNVRGSDILKVTNKKQGAWLKQLLDDLVKLVILKKLPNDKEKLLEYVKERLDEK